ncbi:MAG: cytochrome P450 [Potamolinea sp.]
MKLPPGPGLSLFTTIQSFANPLEYLEDCSQRYGDTFTGHFPGFPPIVSFSNPQAIQQIFTAEPHYFHAGEGNKTLIPLLGENSMIRLDGVPHQRQRRLLTPPFHGERMRAYGKIICEITEQLMNGWKIGNSQAIHSSMQEISLRVILRAVFGISEGERLEKIRELLNSLLETFNSPLSSSMLFFPFLQKDLGAWSPWGRFLRLRQQVDELLYAEIRERKENPDVSGDDILSLMLSARDEDGQPMTDVELRDELMTLLFGGHETTASALAWAFYWIHYLPEVGEKLLKELDSLGNDPEPMEIAKLPYLSAVCSETLRFYPIVLFSFGRIVKSPIEIMGYEFEPGVMLAPCIYLTHHREDIYPEPERFKPERFLERQFSPYEYFPFGGGNRRCIGYAFALFEMKLVLATVLSRFQFSLVDNRPIKPVRRGITMTPAGGVKMMMTSQRERVSTPVHV